MRAVQCQPIRLTPKSRLFFFDKLLKPSSPKGAKKTKVLLSEGRRVYVGVRRSAASLRGGCFALPWRLKAENTTDVSTSAVATKLSHLAFLLLSRSLVLQA